MIDASSFVRPVVDLARRPPSGLHRLACVAMLASAAAGAFAQQAPASVVQVDEVRRAPLNQTVPVIGRLVPRRAGDVSARVAGAVAVFAVQVGDDVRPGDPIAKLDTETLDLQRSLAAARVTEARADVVTREAEVALAEQQRARHERLSRTNATSRSQYEDALQAEAIARARVTTAKAALQIVTANLRLANADLANAEIKAPYAATVIRRYTEVGAYVRVGDPIASLVSTSTLEIEADVPGDRIAGLRAGDEVDVRLDDGSLGRARVRALLPQENPSTRTRAVRFVAEFDGTERPLAAAQSVTVFVPVGRPRDVVSVHKDAINHRGGKTLVFVVHDGEAQIRPVELGEIVGDRIEVKSGLAEGDLAVVRGNERLRPNDKVRVAEAAS